MRINFLLVLLFMYSITLFSPPPLLLIEDSLNERADGKKGELEVENAFEYIKQGNSIKATTETNIAYAITKRLAVEAIIPVFAINTDGPFSSDGIADMMIRLRWTATAWTYNNFFLKAGLQFPTGSFKKRPTTGSGSLDFFYEAKFIHQSPKWHMSARANGLITGPHSRAFYGGDEFLL